MNEEQARDGMTRRVFLKAGGVTAAAIGGAAAIGSSPWSVAARIASAAPVAKSIQLGVSDGFAWLPGIDGPEFDRPGGSLTEIPWMPGQHGLYVFGFKDETGRTFKQVVKDVKGKIQTSAPILAFDETTDVRIKIANAAFRNRPDLSDSHTIHWHGFRQAIPLFDGVPEVSIAVPQGKTFTYEYKPRDAGTYMYHCHFEDVEHVQMGMQGIVYVRPVQNGHAHGGFTKFAYNDVTGSTGYNREYSFILNDIWTEAHLNDMHIQESIWTDYKADYWTINGRAYPDTVKAGWTPGTLPPTSVLAASDPLRILNSQPISSLMQVNPGNRVLIRIANLGYEQQSMHCPGIPMRVVGEDSELLRGPTGADESYVTDTIYLGSGEARDVIFTAPAFSADSAETDPKILPGRRFNRYPFLNRNLDRLNNYGHTTDGSGGEMPGLGGQVTEVRVYETALPTQGLDDLNKTYW
jgi:Multicopper oxidase